MSPRRISSTRPFHSAGLSARSLTKCASISRAPLDRERPRARLEAQIEPRQRNDRDVVHARASSQARNAAVKPRSCLPSRRPRRRRSTRRSACRRAIFSVVRSGSAGPSRSPARCASEVLAVPVLAVRRQIAREGRRRRAGRRIFGDAHAAARTCARGNRWPGSRGLAAEHEGRRDARRRRRPSSKCARSEPAAPDRIEPAHRHDRERLARRPALRRKSVEADVGAAIAERRRDRARRRPARRRSAGSRGRSNDARAAVRRRRVTRHGTGPMLFSKDEVARLRSAVEPPSSTAVPTVG